MPQMQQTGSLVWDAVISAIDACAARQSLCDANAAIWDRDADNAAMPQTQQYPLQYAVNATRGLGCCKTSICFGVSCCKTRKCFIVLVLCPMSLTMTQSRRHPGDRVH